MTPEQAEGIARVIGQLWGVDRGDEWVAFYAAAILDLEQRDAARSVKALFATERFCPTPQQIIDHATGSSPTTALTALRNAHRNQPLPEAVRVAAVAVWGNLDAIPTGPLPRQQQDDFIRIWRDHTVTHRKAAITDGHD